MLTDLDQTDLNETDEEPANEAYQLGLAALDAAHPPPPHDAEPDLSVRPAGIELRNLLPRYYDGYPWPQDWVQKFVVRLPDHLVLRTAAALRESHFRQLWANAHPSHPTVADLGLFDPDASDWAEAAHDGALLEDMLTALGERLQARRNAKPLPPGVQFVTLPW